MIGFVLGKFMPLHKGHLALIDFAYNNCDKLHIIVCYTKNEPIPGNIRTQWMAEEIKKYPNAVLVPFQYDADELPNTSESSRQVSEKWADALKKIVPGANLFFTSEPYGDYVAEFMSIRHIIFDQPRNLVPVSGKQIREFPFHYWDYIAGAAKPFFVKKIALIGSESTGKTTLTEKLAHHYNTSFVLEMAREVVEKTEECTYDNLLEISKLQTSAIVKKLPEANKFIFVDTELIITKSYSEFLFTKKLVADKWIEDANHFDLYLFLETDCDYIQDGTRLSEPERERLSGHHKAIFHREGISFVTISGNWEERFQQAKRIVEEYFLI
ncbi:MAG: AAA family ATPase [Chitinophagaceae bacterium]